MTTTRRSILLRAGQLARVVVSLLLSALLTSGILGCSTSKHNRHEADVEKVAQHGGGNGSGYLPAQQHAFATIDEVWTLGAKPVEMSALLPSGRGEFPVIFYLPGMGEPSAAGAAWRKAWARAGYAVVSVQPAASGPSLWSSSGARAGEFKAVAREQFSAGSLDQRVGMFNDALEELKRRKAGFGGEAFAHIDLSRLAVAGFDLGAQAAMAVAGENASGRGPYPAPEAVRCVIVLSPFADFSGAGFEQRFRSVRVPVLTVTSTDDIDAYGLVTTPSLRRAPFDYMPPGQKYLMSLYDAPHALLSGAESPTRPADTRREGAAARPSGDGDSSSGGGRRRKGHRGSDHTSEGSSAASEAKVPLEAWTGQLNRVERVTTAYLDAMVKADPIATEWLERDATRWLGDSAELLTK
jgi:predicted dienelactone hydrolase